MSMRSEGCSNMIGSEFLATLADRSRSASAASNVGQLAGQCGKVYARVWQPFLQLDISLTRRHSGTRLGLVLVKRMAQLHGGHVGVESSPGQGSHFCLALPWRAPETVQVWVQAGEGA